MRFVNRESNHEFDPNSAMWPEQAWVEHDFVDFRVFKSEDKVVAENPDLTWDLNEFLEAVASGEGIKNLFRKAKNIVPDYESFSGELKFATWFASKPTRVFQIAYEPC